MKCYISGEELTPENRSVEHIIQNFLGGRLKSDKLMTSSWNTQLSQIDSELSKRLLIGEFIQTRKDRNTTRRFAAVDDIGNRFLVDGVKRQVEKRPMKPREFFDLDGSPLIEIQGAKAIEDYLKTFKKKHGLSDEELQERIVKMETSPVERNIFPETPSGEGIRPLDGIDTFRAIAKIAANFYVHSTEDTESVQPLVPFIRDGSTNEREVIPYYRQTRNNLGLSDQEISHILLLKGCPKDKLLYCYIELFNVYNFIVIINEDYRGNEIEYSYRFDLTETQEIKTPLNFQLEISDIQTLSLNSEENRLGFNNRLATFCQICGLPLVLK